MVDFFSLVAVQHERGPRKPKTLSSFNDSGRSNMDDSASDMSTPPPPPQLHPRLSLQTPPFPTPPHSDTAMDLSKHAATSPYPPLLKLPQFTSPKIAYPSATHPFPQGLLLPAQMGFAQSVMAAERYSHDVTEQGMSALMMPPRFTSSVVIRESLQESSARMLFSIVHWLRCVGAFSSLPAKCQVNI